MPQRPLPTLQNAKGHLVSMRRITRVLVVLVALFGVSTVSQGGPSNASVRTASLSAQPRPAVDQVQSAIPAAPGLASTPLASIPASGRPFREVFGYALAQGLSDPKSGYPSWNFSLLSTVAFYGLHITWDGTIVRDTSFNVWNSTALTGMVNAAHASGTKVVVSMILGDFATGTPNMCAGLINRAITVSQIAAQVRAKGVDGVNIDYESVNKTCQNGQSSQSMITDLARQLRAALAPGADISIATYASSAGSSTSFFDIPGLSAYVDSFFVMAYDFEWSNYPQPPISCHYFCLGPASPLTAYYWNDTSIVSRYLSVVSPSKVILGLPYYGRKACVTSPLPNAIGRSTALVDTYLEAKAEITSPSVRPGSYVTHRDVHDVSGLDRYDTWFDTSLNCARELYIDDPVSLGRKYDLVNANGLRGVGFWTLNYGGGSPELWGALFAHFVACSAVSVSESPASPTHVKTTVTMTASAFGCPNPSYQFWLLSPGASTWWIAQQYSTNPVFNWNPGAKAGTYRIAVWVRDANSKGRLRNGLGTWDVSSNSQHTAATSTACTSLDNVASPPSPSHSGSVIAFTASAAGCPNPSFEFLVFAPGARSWQIARPYSTTASFNWNTSGKPVGTYRITAWARDANSPGTFANTLGRRDISNDSQHTLVPATACMSVTETATPPSTSTPGTVVTFTAAASDCPNARYQFWMLAPGARAWQTVQAYSPNAVFSWDTTGMGAGTYRVTVWARDAASPGTTSGATGSWDITSDGEYTIG